MSAPERIWIEHGDECPYFYEEDELHEVGSAVIEYLRSDIAASQLAEARAERDLARNDLRIGMANFDSLEAERDRLAADNARLEVENATLRMHAEARAILAGKE